MAKKKAASAAKEVKVDRRKSSKDRRTTKDRRQKDVKVEVERRKSPRRTVARRRQIDPTTCERDYSSDEIEFMRALDEYKRANGRMFPTCSEILEVIRKLGYQRIGDAPPCADATETSHDEPPSATDETLSSDDAAEFETESIR